MSCRLAREPHWGVELAAVESRESAQEPRVSAVTDLETCNSKGGEPVLIEWSLEKQVDVDIRVGLGCGWMMADMVGGVGCLVWWCGGPMGKCGKNMGK